MSALTRATVARQGHRYRLKAPGHTPCDVLALESGPCVVLAKIVHGQPWLGEKVAAYAFELEPLPMVYFHGEVPR